jgi:hypothetical protein
MSFWRNATERLSTDILLSSSSDQTLPLFIVPIGDDHVTLLIEFVDRYVLISRCAGLSQLRFTGYSLARSHNYTIKIRGETSATPLFDPHCLCLLENHSSQHSLGPFTLDPIVRVILDTTSEPVPQGEKVLWSIPTSFSLSLTLLSTTAPPSHLIARSRPVQLLLSPLASIPIQLLSSLSVSSIPHLFSTRPDPWLHTLLFGPTCGMVTGINLSTVSHLRPVFDSLNPEFTTCFP